MSTINYINDLFKTLDLDVNLTKYFCPLPYPGSDSCIKEGYDSHNRPSRFIRLRALRQPLMVCPHCGTIDKHESKGIRKICLTHISSSHQRFVLEVEYRRYHCHHCHKYFKDNIPFKFYNTMMTNTAAQSCLLQLRENSALAVIARMMGVSHSSVYRLFYNHISVKSRSYHLKSVISVDEFRATTDKGTYAFHIGDPINGKTIDIVEDRKASCLKRYFQGFPYSERKKVKIIIMDLSHAFYSTMNSLFPKASIIIDRFHYIRLLNDCLKNCRLDTCNKLSNKALAKSIKRHLHLFDKYKKELDDEYEWYDYHLKQRFTSKEYIQYIFEQDGTEIFYESYKIYQKMLTLIHENHNDYKQELNDWIDDIFKKDNKYFIATAANIRKKWFIPLLKSLIYKAKYKRNGKVHITSFNNGFIESMNNKVKLVKRNAYGYKYFINLRKRILIHLNFGYEFI